MLFSQSFIKKKEQSHEKPVCITSFARFITSEREIEDRARQFAKW